MSDSVDRVFVHALSTVKRIPRTGSARPPPEDRLKLYGLYKQSMEGDVEGVMPRPEGDSSDAAADGKKWDAWSAHQGITRTEAKRRYISTLIETMHKYASTTTEARELVSELEFVWDQIKSNSASSSASSPGQIARSQGQQMVSSYTSLVNPSRTRGQDAINQGLRVLRPVSDGDEESSDEGDDFQEASAAPFEESQEAATAEVAQGRDLDIRNRKWRKRIEQALVKMTTEVAALKEQVEAKSIREARRRNGVWAWIRWLVWVAFKHAVIDVVILGVLVLWARGRGDQRVEMGLKILRQMVREQVGRLRLPGMQRRRT